MEKDYWQAVRFVAFAPFVVINSCPSNALGHAFITALITIAFEYFLNLYPFEAFIAGGAVIYLLISLVALAKLFALKHRA